VNLEVPDLAAQSQRRSEKWSAHERGVLPSTTAEMDFPLAPAVAAALHVAEMVRRMAAALG
jgi:cysteine-S-conjugate beta-lyase